MAWQKTPTSKVGDECRFPLAQKILLTKTKHLFYIPITGIIEVVKINEKVVK